MPIPKIVTGAECTVKESFRLFRKCRQRGVASGERESAALPSRERKRVVAPPLAYARGSANRASPLPGPRLTRPVVLLMLKTPLFLATLGSNSPFFIQDPHDAVRRTP